MTRKTEYYCKYCDTEHGKGYDHCPRCGRTKPKVDEPDNPPLDPWNKSEMEHNPLELI